MQRISPSSCAIYSHWDSTYSERFYLGRAWTSPTLIVTTAPAREIMVCIYLFMSVSIDHLSHVCPTLVPKIRVRPEMLCVFRYIDVLTCVIYNCMHSTKQQGWLELLVSAVKIIDKDRLVNAQTHGINGFSLLRQWCCSCPSNLPMHLCESEMTNGLTVSILLFCDVHIDIGATLSLLHCLRVICACRPIQTNSAETSLALLHM